MRRGFARPPPATGRSQGALPPAPPPRPRPVARRGEGRAPREGRVRLADGDLAGGLAAVTELVPAKLADFHEHGELDVAYTSQDLPRFRVNGFRQRGAISFAFRVIPKHVP